METTSLTQAQMQLLKQTELNNSKEYAREKQTVLTKHFLSCLNAETDRLWD